MIDLSRASGNILTLAVLFGFFVLVYAGLKHKKSKEVLLGLWDWVRDK